MLERLSNVIYWVGCAAAAICIALGIFAGFSNGMFSLFLGFSGIGVIAWLVGRACRYVMTGH